MTETGFGEAAVEAPAVQGTSTSTTFTIDPTVNTAGADITEEDLSELRKRDTSAQAHITQLESENATLRSDKSLLADELASSTTLDEVLNRINDRTTETDDGVNSSTVAEIVDQRLTQKANEDTRTQNWNEVLGKLTTTFGDFKTAEAAILERAGALEMTPSEATDLGYRNPRMFYELFLPKTGVRPPQQSIGSAATTTTAASQSQTGDSGVRDKAYYNDLRKTNRDKYWSVETQKQLRRDLYGMDLT